MAVSWGISFKNLKLRLQQTTLVLNIHTLFIKPVNTFKFVTWEYSLYVSTNKDFYLEKHKKILKLSSRKGLLMLSSLMLSSEESITVMLTLTRESNKTQAKRKWEMPQFMGTKMIICKVSRGQLKLYHHVTMFQLLAVICWE